MSKAEFECSFSGAARLSAVSYVVMGLIRLRGSSTPYDLKRAVGRSIRYFWPFPHSQLYVEPDRLAKLGLLDRKREDTGRRRIRYSLTETGESVLSEWLAKSPQQMFELRDTAILQLFLSDFMRPECLGQLARDQVRFHEERIATFKATADLSYRFAGQYRMSPLELGIRLSRTCKDFWSEIEDRSTHSFDVAACTPDIGGRRPRDPGA